MAGPIIMPTGIEILKELYGESDIYRRFKAGELSELEVLLYDREIRYGSNNIFQDLIYKENPLLKMIKKG